MTNFLLAVISLQLVKSQPRLSVMQQQSSVLLSFATGTHIIFLRGVFRPF